MKKAFCIFLISLLALFAVSCSGKNITYNTSTPEDVVRSYFIALNNKDKKFIESVTDKNSHGFNYKDISRIKIIKIREVPNTMSQYDYEYHDVKCFRVFYDLRIKFFKDIYNESGKDEKDVTITKDNENSNWIIREIGEG